MEITRDIELVITGRQYFNATDLFFSPKVLEEVEEFTLPEETEREIELCTFGTLSVTDEGLHLTYEESELTGLKGSQTTFSVSDDLVCLTRSGEHESHLVFEEGKRHLLYHSAPRPPVSVVCRNLKNDLTPFGGELSFDYSVEIAGTTVEHNAYTIRVRV